MYLGEHLESRKMCSTSELIDSAATMTIMSVVYDHPEDLLPKNSIIDGMNELPDEILKASEPGAHLVEFFPWLEYIPSFLAKWKRDARERFQRYTNLYGELFRDVEKRIVSTFLHSYA
jgi:hypothetical protein